MGGMTVEDLAENAKRLQIDVEGTLGNKDQGANPKYALIDLILNERADWTSKNYNAAAQSWRSIAGKG
jgi:hypothetical protein|eukprot:COSAG02_NODE_1777_length_10954_cov_11.819714_5_plen_68_part_00